VRHPIEDAAAEVGNESLGEDRTRSEQRAGGESEEHGAVRTDGGALFGTSAVLTKAFVHYLGGGVFNWVPHWEPYALAVSSITGLVLAQSAFQTGALAAAVSAEQVMQPIMGVALGVGLLDEKLGITGSVESAMLIVALFAMLWGVLTITRVENPEILVPPALADG